MSQPPWGQPSGPSPWGQRQAPGNPYGRQAPPGWGQQPGFGQPYGQNPYGLNLGGPRPPMTPFGRPPRRRRSPIGMLLRAAMALGLLLLLGSVAGNLASSSSSPSSSAPTGPYQNDDYTVPPPDTSPPPLPQPETYEEARTLLTDNPAYAESLPAPVRCDSQPIRVGSASDAQLKSHFEELMECLVRAWEPPVTAAGFQVVRPTVTIYGREITTRCGKAEVNAFYCGADQQVYYSNLLDDSVTIVDTEKWAADVVMAHEFAHAVQARTAILISETALSQQSEDESTQLLYARRLETQADCFSGLFLYSTSTSLGIEPSDQRGISATYRAVGDDSLSGDPGIEGNHGLARTREYWGNTGLGTSEVGRCNTFSAKANLVR